MIFIKIFQNLAQFFGGGPAGTLGFAHRGDPHSTRARLFARHSMQFGDRMREHLRQQLKLTPEQSEKIGSLVHEMSKRLEVIREDTSKRVAATMGECLRVTNARLDFAQSTRNLPKCWKQAQRLLGPSPRITNDTLGPLLFEPYADNLVARLPKQNDISVLETACGTGIVTQRLAAGFARRRDANRDRS